MSRCPGIHGDVPSDQDQITVRIMTITKYDVYDNDLTTLHDNGFSLRRAQSLFKDTPRPVCQRKRVQCFDCEFASFDGRISVVYLKL